MVLLIQIVSAAFTQTIILQASCFQHTFNKLFFSSVRSFILQAAFDTSITCSSTAFVLAFKNHFTEILIVIALSSVLILIVFILNNLNYATI